MVAAVVWASDAEPIAWWPLSVAWLALLALLGFLMVSTWRYYSFKGISLSKAYSPLHHHSGRRVHLRRVELRAAAVSCHGHCLRGQRHRDPHWRHPAPPPADPRPATPGDQDWLIIRPLPWSAAKPCWPAKSATSWPPPAPDLDLRLIAAEEEEPARSRASATSRAWSNRLDAESLRDARAVILAGNAESSRKALELLGDPPDAAVIDLTYAAEERPDARLRAPAGGDRSWSRRSGRRRRST